MSQKSRFWISCPSCTSQILIRPFQAKLYITQILGTSQLLAVQLRTAWFAPFSFLSLNKCGNRADFLICVIYWRWKTTVFFWNIRIDNTKKYGKNRSFTKRCCYCMIQLLKKLRCPSLTVRAFAESRKRRAQGLFFSRDVSTRWQLILHPSAYPARPHTTASYARTPACTSPGCKSRGRRRSCARAASLSRRRTTEWTSSVIIS